MSGMSRICSALRGYIQKSRVAKLPFLRAFRSSNDVSSTRTRSQATDWNTRSEFFKFTRGRFVLNEEENLRQREVTFDMNELAKVAADSVGAAQCVEVIKFTDGLFNKAFLMRMNDGQEVVAKVPNPNAGRAHYTTASEVATMDFARRVLDTPVPRVYTWSSNAQSHSVGAEYIIMEKAQGIPLSLVWDRMLVNEKFKVLLALVQIQKRWLNTSFSHYGSLYYAKDVQSSPGSHCVQDGVVVETPEFVIGPSTGRDWHDHGRASLDIERGPWSSLSQYLRSIGEREAKAIQTLNPPKQITMFCGPKLCQPDVQDKLTALDQYQHVFDAVLPENKAMCDAYLWHDDLHGDNIFVNPRNPEKITAIIDWQSCHIAPLFKHNADPAILDRPGSEPEKLELTPKPDVSGLSSEEKSAAYDKYAHVNLFIAWRKIMRAKSPNLFAVTEFRKTPSYGLLFFADRMFEYGEGHFRHILLDVKDAWPTLPAVATSPRPFPFSFSDAEIERIKARGDGEVSGTRAVDHVKEVMGELWPHKGVIDHEHYDDCRAALKVVKAKMVEQLAANAEERAEYERHWPFD